MYAEWPLFAARSTTAIRFLLLSISAKSGCVSATWFLWSATRGARRSGEHVINRWGPVRAAAWSTGIALRGSRVERCGSGNRVSDFGNYLHENNSSYIIDGSFSFLQRREFSKMRRLRKEQFNSRQNSSTLELHFTVGMAWNVALVEMRRELPNIRHSGTNQQQGS